MPADIPDNRNGAQTLLLDTPFQSEFEQIGDSDMFKVWLEAGKTYLIALRGKGDNGGTLAPTGSFDGIANLRVTGGSDYLEYGSGIYGSPNKGPVVAVTPKASGNFYIDTWGRNTGTYTMLATVGPADDYAADAGTKGLLPFGRSVNASLENPNDRDWFKLQVQAGEIYSITVASGDAAFIPSINLTHERGGEAWGVQFTGPGSGSVTATFAAAFTGAYYADVKPWYASASLTGAYTILASAGADDYTANVATTGRLPIGGSSDAAINARGENDWFRVDLEAGKAYAFELAEPAYMANEFYLQLYDANGLALNVPALSAARPYTTDTGGAYFLDVSSAQMSSYTVRATVIADDALNNQASARALALGTAVTGRSEYVTDLDWFALGVTAGQRYVLELAGSSSWGQGYHPTLSVVNKATGATLNVAGTTVPGSDGKISASFEAATTGDFLISVNGPGSLYGNESGMAYSLKAKLSHSDDAGDSQASAAAMSTGLVRIGALEIGSDVDVYKVSLAPGARYVFKLDGSLAVQSGGNPAPISVELAGPGLYYDWKWSAASKDNGFTSATGGDYYFTVKSPAQLSGAYSMLVELAPDDHGASAGTATPLPFGYTGVQGSLNVALDHDWFGVDMKAGQTYWLELNGSVYNVPQALISLQLRDANGALLNTLEQMSGPRMPVLSFVAPADGKYYMDVSAKGAPYNYSVMANPGTPDDAGNTPATAMAYTAGTTGEGRFEVFGDVDVYKVTLDAQSSYGINFNSYRIGSELAKLVTLFRLGADGAEINVPLAPVAYANQGEPVVTAKVTQGGDYYFRMSDGGSRSYPVSYPFLLTKLAGDDHGDGGADATVLPLGVSVAGNLDLFSDVDAFKFSLSAGRSYTIAAYVANDSTPSNARSGFLLDVSDAGGKPVAKSGSPMGASWVSFQSAATGDYVVKLSRGTIEFADGYVIRAVDVTNDKTAPTLSTTAIKGQSLDADIVIVASEYLVQKAPVTLTGADGSVVWTVLTMRDNGQGNTLSIQHGSLKSGMAYTLAIPAGALQDLAGNAFGGAQIAVNAVDTSGNAAPSFVAAVTSPGKITLTFSEALLPTMGRFVLKNGAGNGIEYFDLHFGGNVSVSGNTVILQPETQLAAGQSYQLYSESGQLRDVQGVPMAGPLQVALGQPLPPGLTVLGTDASDYLSGSDVNDGIRGGAGDDTIHGGAGRDTAYYSGARGGYTLTHTPGFFYVSSAAEGADTLFGVERLHFADVDVALDHNGVAGQAYRMYRAVLNREPDGAGLGYWIGVLDKGATLQGIAAGFVQANEFKALFGAAPTSLELVERLYQNVLHRNGEKAGIDYWTGILDSKAAGVADVLASFSESKENVDAALILIGNGFDYIPYLG